jgi:hypothetical protein
MKATVKDFMAKKCLEMLKIWKYCIMKWEYEDRAEVRVETV